MLSSCMISSSPRSNNINILHVEQHSASTSVAATTKASQDEEFSYSALLFNQLHLIHYQSTNTQQHR